MTLVSGDWTAIILAGQRPGPDPLASHFGQHYKALVPVRGSTMLEHVVRCLFRVPQIARIVILAQEPDRLIEAVPFLAGSEGKITTFAGKAGIAESVSTFLRGERCPWPVLLTTADHPLLTPEIVEQFLSAAAAGDLAVGAVERRTMMARYPQTRRTWLSFADGAYSGANLFALRSDRAQAALDFWSRAERDRKQVLKLFWRFGPLLALRAALRLIGFGDAIARAGRRLGIDARLVVLDQAEAAIDVDKLSDHRLVETILADRDGKPALEGAADMPQGGSESTKGQSALGG